MTTSRTRSWQRGRQQVTEEAYRSEGRPRTACADLRSSDILQVARAEVPRSTPAGWWPCPFCGYVYRIHDCWLVDYVVEPTRQAARAYVCASCAHVSRAALAEVGR